MYTPSQHDVRRFFCEVHRKQQSGLPMAPLELTAADWIARHPEYFEVLGDLATALAAPADPASGHSNAFLHLSMHLSIAEQTAIDQPTGIRQCVALLSARLGSDHEAHHEVMECLGEMIWHSQRHGQPPDGQRYLDCVRRRATPR